MWKEWTKNSFVMLISETRQFFLLLFTEFLSLSNGVQLSLTCIQQFNIQRIPCWGDELRTTLIYIVVFYCINSSLCHWKEKKKRCANTLWTKVITYPLIVIVSQLSCKIKMDKWKCILCSFYCNSFVCLHFIIWEIFSFHSPFTYICIWCLCLQ